MAYTNVQRTTQTKQAVFMGCRTQARWKAHYKRIRAAIRTATGWTTAIMFFLVLGKAGASDCGAPMRKRQKAIDRSGILASVNITLRKF